MLPTPLRAHLPLFLYLGLGLTGCGQAGRADGEEAGGGGGIVLDEQVRVIDDVDEVIVEADRLRFPVATHADLADLAAGVVVVGDRQGAGSQRNGNPDGFLRRVLGAGVVGDEVVLRTEMASLMDVVDEGQISTVIDVPGGAPVGLVEAANGTLRARRPGVVLGSGPDLVRRQYAPFPIADRLRVQALGPLEFTGLKLGPVDRKLKREFTVKGVPVVAEMYVRAQLDVAEGSLSLEPDFGLSADYSIWSGLKGFEFFLAGALEARLKTHFEFETGIDVGVDYEKLYGEASAAEKKVLDDELAAFARGGPLPPMSAKIAEAHIDLATWWLPTLIPIPVVSTAVFELGIVCDASVKGSAEATFRQDASASLKVGGRYVKNAGWSAIDERAWKFVPSTEVVGAVEAEAQCELLPKFTLHFYGLGGPEIYAGAAAKGSLSASQSCPGMEGRPRVDVSATLAASVSAGVAAKFGLFIPRLDINYTIAETMLEVFRQNYDLGDYDVWSGYPDYGFDACPESAAPCDGDGTCEAGETCMACAADCGACVACGDGVCVQGESCAACPADCGTCDGCGDGQCKVGEDCQVCPEDCGACEVCGDDVCAQNEWCDTCMADCGGCTCGCVQDPQFTNYCQLVANTTSCPMTAPGGYCDPNGDGDYALHLRECTVPGPVTQHPHGLEEVELRLALDAPLIATPTGE